MTLKRMAIFAVALLVLVGCERGPTTPGDVNVNVNVNVGQPTPAPSSSPEAGGTVSRVGVGKVAGAESCPANVQPSGRGDAVRVGCTAFLTCSPYDSANRELFDPASIGTAPDSFGLVGGDAVTVAPHGTNPFNLDAKGERAGTVSFACKVRGVQSPPFVLAVVQ